MISMSVILVLVFLAVIAPFIAGDVPIRWVENGHASWPIFQYLTGAEYSAMVAFLLGITLPLTARLMRRRAERKGGSAMVRAILIGLAVWVVVTGLCVGLHEPERRYGFFLERRDQAESAWFPLIPTPHNPGYDALAQRDLPPSWQHPLGTDRLGEDVVLRVLYGARTAMAIGFVAVGIGSFIGISLGSISGYFGRWIDLVLMRIAEIFMFLPTLILIIIILTVIPSWVPALWAVVGVIGVTGWTGSYRLMRAELMRIRNEDYITAARAIGVPTWRLLLRHAIPNGLAPILVGATFGIAGAVFLEVTLSFLSLVNTPSWGELLNDGRQHASTWWVWGAAGAAIFVTVLVYNLLGEAVRDAIDPKLKI
jgi:peptide/nickel transport system permease protein